MTTFFPTLYPDELLYSAVARYHQRSGNITWRETIEDLFDSKITTVSMELPVRMKTLVDKIPSCGNGYEEELIWHHTLYPYYTAYLSEEKRVQIWNSMLHSNNGSYLNAIAGLLSCLIKPNINLHYCPDCVKEDILIYGETYWRRIHQLPGVLVCPKHYRYLQKSPIRMDSSNRGLVLLANDCVAMHGNLTKSSSIEEITYNKKNLLNSISNMAYELMNDRLAWKSMYLPYITYQKILYEKGYANANGEVRQNKIRKDFESYYGKNFLELLQCEVSIERQTDWFKDMIRKSGSSVHPLRNMLVMIFLEISFEDLKCSDSQIRPFGIGPWPCLNAGANHYKEPIVRNIKITHSDRTGKVVGTFLCDCGFEYSRSGPDSADSDKYRISRMKCFGKVWENKLETLIDQNLPLKEIARNLNVSKITVDKYSLKLGLYRHWAANQKYIEKHANTKVINVNDFGLSRQLFRDKWIKISKDNPDKTKTKARAEYPTVYAWLYRHDKDWINSYSDHNLGQRQRNYVCKVNWHELDKCTKEAAILAVQNLRNNTNKPIWITMTRIGREIGKHSLIQKNLDKMPMTKKFISGVVESREEHQKRKFYWALNELLKEGDDVSVNKVMRKAVITHKKDYMDQQINCIVHGRE